MLDDPAPESDRPALAGNAAHLEQQMAALGLSNDTRRFLRDVQRAEKVLNNAYGNRDQHGALDKRISQIYRDLYGSSGALSTGS